MDDTEKREKFLEEEWKPAVKQLKNMSEQAQEEKRRIYTFLEDHIAAKQTFGSMVNLAYQMSFKNFNEISKIKKREVTSAWEILLSFVVIPYLGEFAKMLGKAAAKRLLTKGAANAAAASQQATAERISSYLQEIQSADFTQEKIRMAFAQKMATELTGTSKKILTFSNGFISGTGQ
ncbi:MAG: hypothetical protein AAF570_28265, partial [Bacteroidota bacterium]